jgi:mRNA interferase YafQ
MRKIKYVNAFKRDYKREKSGKSLQHAEKLDRELMEVVTSLASDAALPRRHADHPLTG